jgi:hypothetical protein
VCVAAEAGVDRVLGDVLGGGGELTVGFDDHGAKSALEHVARALMALVECLCVTSVYALYAFAEISIGSLQEEVKVIAHQAVRKTPPPQGADNAAEQPQVEQAIRIVKVDGLAVVAARVDVVDAVDDILAGLPGHVSKDPAGHDGAPCRRAKLKEGLTPFIKRV